MQGYTAGEAGSASASPDLPLDDLRILRPRYQAECVALDDLPAYNPDLTLSSAQHCSGPAQHKWNANGSCG